MNARSFPEGFALGAATPALRDHRWLELTSTANQALKVGSVELARTLYRRALTEAEQLLATLDPDGTAVPLPAIMNIACHNLAEICAKDGNEAERLRLLILAFDRLIGTAEQPAARLDLRLACVAHLKYTLAELAEHLAEAPGDEPPIGHYLARLREVAATVIRTAATTGRVKRAQSRKGGRLAG